MTAPWTLHVLGQAALRGEARTIHLERRMALLLTYLTLEGPASRARIATLLWPDAEARTARNNLVQSLRRLQRTTGAALVLAGERLELSDEVTADIAQLQLLALQAQAKGVLEVSGELLPFTYDDLPELESWLTLERERLVGLRRDALGRLAAEHENDRDYVAALDYARALLALDPLREESYRLLMRLYYLAGERGEALKTFERCKTVLHSELGLEPLPETEQLAGVIRSASPAKLSAATPKSAIPLSVLRPPVLVGREALWRRLKDAWEEGRTVYLRGEAGLGKTRLVQDFLAARGFYHRFAGRPGDDAVPLSPVARALRPLLEGQRLEPWVRRELSRLLPHLSPAPPPPISHAGEKGRFYEAVAESLLQFAPEPCALVWDDLHYLDTATLEFAQYLANRSARSIRTFSPAN